jgi:hypothetical protein
MIDPATDFVPTRPAAKSWWATDGWRLAVLLFMAVTLRAWVIANTTVPSRDCIVFVRYALDLGDPPSGTGGFLGVIKTAEHPPGYPLAVLAASKIVCPFAGAPSPESMGLSAQIASAFAGVLLTIPLYSLVRRITDRNTAFAATGVFGVLPGFVEVTSDGISDGLFWLTAVTALWFAVGALRAADRRTATVTGLGAGVMCGLGYLVRPEAAVVALSIGLTLAGVVLAVWRQGRKTGVQTAGARPRLIAGLMLCIGWVAVTAPYMGLIGRFTNKPTGDAWFKKAQGKEIDKTYFDRQSARPAVRLPLAAWWDPNAFQGQTKTGWAARSLWYEYWKASFYVLPAFALIGLFGLRRRLSDPRIILLLTTAGVQAVLLWSLAVWIGYVSQRHTILIVMVTAIFAAAAFPYLGKLAISAWHTEALSGSAIRLVATFSSVGRGEALVRWMRGWRPWELGAIWAAIVMAVALPRNFHSLHEERKGHKLAGLWMKENVSRECQIVDPFGWAEWYTGRTLRAVPNPDVYKPGPDMYVVFTPNAKSPHSRLGIYKEAGELHKCRKPVFQYPPNVPEDEIDVAVYKAPPLPPPVAPATPGN